MGIKCLMNGLEVNYPCSPACALFGDCVTAFETHKKASVRTNADHIRSMTDEELCKFLGECKFCDICEEGCDACTYSGDCDKRLLDWLKQPAGGADHE